MDCIVLFFFKQKTAYKMRISDWSSDVCSSDLLPLSLARGRFEQIGASVAVSSPELVEIARDKLETARFLARHDIPSPATAAAEDVRDNPDAWDWPLIVKARGGSARRGLRLELGRAEGRERGGQSV